MRPIAALFLLVFLAACSPEVVSPGPSVIQPHLTADAVIMSDGARLPLKTWLPDGRPKAVILALHGFNDYSNAFAPPAPYLTAHGIALYAYDQRGFGRAPNPGSWAGIPALVDDAATAARLIEARYPGVPFYLLGESMGGAVAMLTVTGATAPPVKGTILVAPAVWARRRMSLLERSALWLSSHAVPWYSVTGKDLDIWPSDNVPMLRALSKDPLVIKETKVGTIDGLVNLMDAAYAAAPRLPGPALALYGEHDEVIPPHPTYDVMASFSDRANIACAIYPKGYHMLLRDLQADTVLGDIVAWIANPGAPLPSGADARAMEVLAKHRATPVVANAGSAG